MNYSLNIGKVDFSDNKLYLAIRSIFDAKEVTASIKKKSYFPLIAFPVAVWRFIRMIFFPTSAASGVLAGAVGVNPAVLSNPAGLLGAASPAGLLGAAGAPAGLLGTANPAAALQGATSPAGLAGLAGAPAGLLGTANPAGLAGLAGAPAAVPARTSSKPTTPKPIQKGGAKDELSTESQILGAAVFAIIGGGIMKAVVDNLI